LKGHLKIRFWDRSDNLVREVASNNSIVLSGRDLVAKLFINQTITPISHLAVGLDDSAVAAGNTQLGNELFRKAINTPNPSTDITVTSADKIKVTLTADLDFTEGNGVLREAALFNDPNPNTGVMYNRVVFPQVTKTTDFKLTFVWEVLF
jgi:hypothetical protein